MVAELLAEEAERRGQLSDSGYGSRNKRLAIDTAAIMVNIAHAAGKKSHISCVLLMDIKAAFPSIGRRRQIQAMRDK